MATAFTYMKTGFNCCGFAAACSSAYLAPMLDTARELVVSICICLRPLRVCGQRM